MNNKFDFTEGEWEQSYFKDSIKYNHMSKEWKNNNQIEEKRRVYSKKGRFICRCINQNTDIELDLKEDIANARLISCAPEMILALIKNTKILLSLQKTNTIKDIGKWIKSMEFNDDIELIEKATGKKWEDII